MDDLATIAARHRYALEPAWIWDADRRRILWANDAALTLFGEQSLFDLIEQSFAAGAPETKAAARTGDAIDVTLAPAGAPVNAVVDVSNVAILQVKRARLVVVREIRPRVVDEKTRRAALFDFAPVPLVLATLDGAIIETNAAAAMLNGGKLRTLADALGEAPAKRLLARAVAAGHAGVSAERHGRTLRAVAVRVADPIDGGALVLIRLDDVTSRRALEAMHQAQLAQLQSEPAPVDAPAASPDALRAAETARDEADRKSAMKSEFIAKLSHEMRNPLNAIIGFSEIMQQRHFGPLGDRHYETYADDIRTSADHLLSLVDDLQDLARVEAGKLNLSVGPVSLRTVIDDCVRLLRPAASGYGVTLSAEIGNLPPVRADARSLKQMLINLISNALKFTAKGGVVRVMAAAEAGGAVTIAIADTGVGMSPPEMQLALEPFGQVDGKHQHDRKGTGLGLPLAKALAEANKCGFEIVSEPQKGTLVRLTFPPPLVLGGNGSLPSTAEG